MSPELAARITAARAVLTDYRADTDVDMIGRALWAGRLAGVLSPVLDELDRVDEEQDPVLMTRKAHPPMGRTYTHPDVFTLGVAEGWAEAETDLDAAVRELTEETGLAGVGGTYRVMPPRYVPDPRSSDEAWAVTVPVHIDLGTVSAMPDVNGADDARRAEWIRADSYALLAVVLDRFYGGRVFAAHVAMLGDFLGGGNGTGEDSSKEKSR